MIIDLIKIIAVLLAAVILGNSFLDEVKKAKRLGAPWYQPYFSIPGVLIIVAILLPVLYCLINQ